MGLHDQSINRRSYQSCYHRLIVATWRTWRLPTLRGLTVSCQPISKRAPLATTYIQARFFITQPTCNTFSNHSIFWPRVMKINNRREKLSCIYHCGFSGKKYYFYYLLESELIRYYFSTKFISTNILEISNKRTTFHIYVFWNFAAVFV